MNGIKKKVPQELSKEKYVSKEKNIKRITEITMHTVFSCIYRTSKVGFLPEE